MSGLWAVWWQAFWQFFEKCFFFLATNKPKNNNFLFMPKKKKPIRVYNDSSCNQNFPLISKHFNIFQFFFFLIMKSMHSMTTVTSIPDTFLLVSFKGSRVTKLYAGTKSAQFSPVLHNKMQKLLIISKHMLYMIPRSVYNRDDVNMHIACIH